MVLEIQQSSDITYRVYDFERQQKYGILRKLHIEESKDYIMFPDNNIKIKNLNNGNLISNNFFTIDVINNNNNINKKVSLSKDKWGQITIIEGNGKINDLEVKKGESYIIPINIDEILISGSLKLVLGYQ